MLLGVLALAWMRRKGAAAAVPIVLIATIFLFVAGGLADATTLGNSQLPTTLPATLARLLVMVTLGVGAGLAVASGASAASADGAKRHRATGAGTRHQLSSAHPA